MSASKETLAKIVCICMLISFGFSDSSFAALVDRGRGLIYDTVLDVTWLQDANYARNSGYVADYDVLGRMTWDEALEWIEYLNSNKYLGYNNWRLPKTLPVNNVTYNYSLSYDGSTDIGYNNTSQQSEMAYMFYITLGNLAYYDTQGNYPQDGWGLKNVGPFTNLENSINSYYWSGTQFSAPGADAGSAWNINFYRGFQRGSTGDGKYYAWPVRDGDSPEITSPTVSTVSPIDISPTSASSGGNVSSDGGANVTARGVCWSTSSNPTISDSATNDGEGTGNFTSSITGLSPGMEYHVRAYATNNAGKTGYGEDERFDTLATAPTVTTNAVSLITSTTASSGGNATSDGGASITAKGVYWSTSANPTIADNITDDGTNTGAFVSNLAGLTPGTTYHVRAYATNSAGNTGYGNDVSFTTAFTYIIYVNQYDSTCHNHNPCYTSIQAAIQAAKAGSAIRIAHGEYYGEVTLNEFKTVTLQGGWRSDFTLQDQITTLHQEPRVDKGAVRLQTLSIKP